MNTPDHYSNTDDGIELRQIQDTVVGILVECNPKYKGPINAQTNILSELDMDSLALLDFLETINHRYGVNLLRDMGNINFSSAEGVATAVLEQVKTMRNI